MKTKITNENLVNNSNQPQNIKKMNKFQKEILIQMVDNLLLERLPNYISDELKWIRKEYGDDEISEFLCEEIYHSESPLLKKLELLYED